MNIDNWLITGGCGFIGRTLIKQLLENNLARSIRVVDNLSESERSDLAYVCEFSERSIDDLGAMGSAGVELVVSDIRDAEEARLCTKGADAIIHLAANTGVQPSIQNPRADMESNVIGVLNYLEAARANQVKKFVFASSGAPIGEAEPPIHENLPCRPISPYGASKLAGEAYCSAYNGSFGLNTVVLRFSNVYGPMSGKKGSVVAKFIRQAMAGEDWVINGGGAQTRDFIYSEDLAKAIILAATTQFEKAEIFQIATQEETSIQTLAKLLAAALSEHLDITTKTRQGEKLLGDVARNFADISHSRDALKWTPKTTLNSGLSRTVQWFSQ